MHRASSGAIVLDDLYNEADGAGSVKHAMKDTHDSPTPLLRPENVRVSSVSTKGSVQSGIDVSISSSEHSSISIQGLSFTTPAVLHNDLSSDQHAAARRLTVPHDQSCSSSRVSGKRQRQEEEGAGSSSPMPPRAVPQGACSAAEPGPGPGEEGDPAGPPSLFWQDAAWQALCADCGLPPSAWGSSRAGRGPHTGRVQQQQEEDEGMLQTVRQWSISSILAHPAPCVGPIPWLAVRISCHPALTPSFVLGGGGRGGGTGSSSRGISAGAGSGGGGGDDTLLCVVEDPTGRMLALVVGGVACKHGLGAGAVLLLRGVHTYSLHPSSPTAAAGAGEGVGKRLMIGEDSVYRVYKGEE